YRFAFSGLSDLTVSDTPGPDHNLVTQLLAHCNGGCDITEMMGGKLLGRCSILILVPANRIVSWWGLRHTTYKVDHERNGSSEGRTPPPGGAPPPPPPPPP